MAVAALCGLTAAVAAVATAGETRPVVTVSTSLMAGIVRAVAGDRVVVNSLIPPRLCPGHFDLTARQAAATEASALFLAHGFEPFLAELAARMAGRHAVLNVGGNAMVPKRHIVLAAHVRDALLPLLPGAVDAVRGNTDAYIARVLTDTDALRESMAPVSGRPVLASVQNAEVLTWMGLDVVGAFPRDEAAAAQTIAALVASGRSRKVALVADNRQSAGKLGAQLAADIGCRFTLLSNFPDDATAEGYVNALKGLCRQVSEALERP